MASIHTLSDSLPALPEGFDQPKGEKNKTFSLPWGVLKNLFSFKSFQVRKKVTN